MLADRAVDTLADLPEVFSCAVSGFLPCCGSDPGGRWKRAGKSAARATVKRDTFFREGAEPPVTVKRNTFPERGTVKRCTFHREMKHVVGKDCREMKHVFPR